MKYILLLFTILFCPGGMHKANGQNTTRHENTLTYSATSTASNQITAGYCTDELTRGAGLSAPATLSAAIQLPKYKMTPLVGNKITAVRFGIYEYSRASDLEIFITDKLGKEPLYKQKVDDIAIGWNEITLNTPYQITENKEIFIGYNVHTIPPERLIAVDENPSSPLSDWIAQNNEWMHLSSSLDGNISLLAVVEGNNLPLDVNYNICLESVVIKEFVQPGEIFDITGTIINAGNQPVTNFDVTYRIGNSEPVKTVVRSNTIGAGSKYKFTVPGAKITSTGNYNIEVTITPSGYTDEYPADNSLSASSYCYTDFFPRKVLMEQFTGQRCQNCPEGEISMTDAIKGKENKVVWIAHHVGFFEDDFTIPESREYLCFYNGSTYAPAMMLDRLSQLDGQVPVFPSQDITIEAFQQAIEMPAFINIHMNGEYDDETRVLNLHVSGESLRELPFATDIRLNILLTENGKMAIQSGVAGLYEHNHVLRSVITPAWGEPLDLTNNEYTKTYTYTIPKKMTSLDGKSTMAVISDNIQINAFISNYDPDNINNRRILNAESIPLSTIGAHIESINENLAKVYSSGNLVFVTGEHTGLVMYDISGEQVKAFDHPVQSFDIYNIENGVYFIKIINKQNYTIKKILISK